MRIKIVDSKPHDTQEHIYSFIGKEFETSKDKEMNSLLDEGEVYVQMDDGFYIFNKNEYIVID